LSPSEPKLQPAASHEGNEVLIALLGDKVGSVNIQNGVRKKGVEELAEVDAIVEGPCYPEDVVLVDGDMEGSTNPADTFLCTNRARQRDLTIVRTEREREREKKYQASDPSKELAVLAGLQQ